MTIHTIERRIETLHPEFAPIVRRLAEALAGDYKSGLTKTDFQVFETYRSPMRQLDLLAKGTTKAGPFQSAHGFGLAVDFVPRVGGRWTWEVQSSEWDYLRQKAKAFGLANSIQWDRPHVEHPRWSAIRKNFELLL